ncbi:plasmid mobilization protein [Lactococcus lactis]|uniref:plasmid mobilization protein n=1 Tax=Lactococcus lactis TaxID=1358 RepID=UPI000C9F2B4C|nr:hypothetical protein [Lactococcus lactis]AUS70621.1 hypothetical protein LLG50_11320 [Lactococcus lactis subsp. lactis]
MSNQEKIKDKVIRFRLSADEDEVIRQLANSNEMTLSEYVRRRAIKGNINRPLMAKSKAKKVIQALLKLEPELGKQGGNINQLAYNLNKANKNNYFSEVDWQVILEEFNNFSANYHQLRNEVNQIWQLLAR